MNGGPSGFQNAPLTRNLVIFCAFLTAVFVARGHSVGLGFSYQASPCNAGRKVTDNFFKDPYVLALILPMTTLILLHAQDSIQRLRILRVIASVFAFSSLQELIFGLYLLYYFRLFERQIGSNKYSVFVLFTLSVSLLFEVLALVFLKDRTIKILASGPYGLIYASFVAFLFDIPISSQIRIFGVPFSDKSFIYMAGLQLFASSWKRSLVPAICGLLAGSLYRLNVFGIRRFKFPQFLATFFYRLSWSAPGSSLRRTNVRRNLRTSVNHHHQERSFGSTTTMPMQLEPPESSVATLVSMGFDSSSARQALARARNDINVATNILLEAQSH